MRLERLKAGRAPALQGIEVREILARRGRSASAAFIRGIRWRTRQSESTAVSTRLALDLSSRTGVILIVDRDNVPRSDAALAKEWTLRIEISTRHEALGSEQRSYVHEKAEQLQKYFDRLMAIEIAAEHSKHSRDVDLLVSVEHQHDFVARETPGAAMDECVHKIEQQLRKYKEQVQSHQGEPRAGGTSSAAAEPV